MQISKSIKIKFIASKTEETISHFEWQQTTCIVGDGTKPDTDVFLLQLCSVCSYK
jgi:hypothetical protein